MIKNSKGLFLLGILAAVAVFCVQSGLRHGNPTEVDVSKDELNIDKFISKKQKVCFGRFVIDVPEGASIVFGPTEVDGELIFHSDKAAQLDAILASKLREVAERKNIIPEYALPDLPMVGNVFNGEVPGQKTLFGVENSVSYEIDSYIPIGSDLFVYHLRGVAPDANEIPRINKIASQLKYRPALEIPAGEGICIEMGFLDVDPKYENISIGFGFREFSDVRMSIDMRKNQNFLPEGDGPNELREGAKAKAQEAGFGSIFARIKMLREGPKEVGVWKGEEVLTRRPAYRDETDAHEFRFYSTGSVNDKFHPRVDIRLDSGVEGNAMARVKPSITDEEAIALWDRILSTIRLRQPSDVTPVPPASHDKPLGTIETTGALCPESGWWECNEHREIDGNRLRLFSKGERLPPVSISRYSALWRRLIGDSYSIAEVKWKLVQYESQPTLQSSNDRETPNKVHDNGTKDNHA